VIRAADNDEDILLSLWQWKGGEEFAQKLWEKPANFQEGQVQAGAWPEMGVLVQRTATEFFAWDKHGDPVDLKIKDAGSEWGRPESMLFWKGNMHIGFEHGHVGVWNRDGTLVATLKEHSGKVETLLAWGNVLVSVDESKMLDKDKTFIYWDDKYNVIMKGTSTASESYITQARSWVVWGDRLWEFLCHDMEASDVRTYDREGKCRQEGSSGQLTRELDVMVPWGDDTLVAAYLGASELMVLDAGGTNVGVIMDTYASQRSALAIWGEDNLLLAMDEDGSVVAFKKKKE